MRARAPMLAAILLLTFALPLSAQSKTPAKKAAPDFAAMMQKYLDAWGTLDPANAAPYYAKDAGLAFYDIAPEKYTGWSEYAAGVLATFGNDYQSGRFFLGDDVQVHPGRTFAWATATLDFEILRKDGGKELLKGCRWTLIWEKRGAQWLVVHEHFSVPMGMTPQKH